MKIPVEMSVRHLKKFVTPETDKILDVLCHSRVLLVPLVEVHVAVVDGNHFFQSQLVVILRLGRIQD